MAINDWFEIDWVWIGNASYLDKSAINWYFIR
jgi:hypothetical protein